MPWFDVTATQTRIAYAMVRVQAKDEKDARRKFFLLHKGCAHPERFTDDEHVLEEGVTWLTCDYKRPTIQEVLQTTRE